jgi:hypothetical protein
MALALTHGYTFGARFERRVVQVQRLLAKPNGAHTFS